MIFHDSNRVTLICRYRYIRYGKDPRYRYIRAPLSLVQVVDMHKQTLRQSGSGQAVLREKHGGTMRNLAKINKVSDIRILMNTEILRI